MACQIIKNENGKVENVFAENGQPSLLFQKLNSLPFLTEEKAETLYVAALDKTKKGDFLKDVNGEPILVFRDQSNKNSLMNVIGEVFEESYETAFKNDYSKKGIEFGFLKGSDVKQVKLYTLSQAAQTSEASTAVEKNKSSILEVQIRDKNKMYAIPSNKDMFTRLDRIDRNLSPKSPEGFIERLQNMGIDLFEKTKKAPNATHIANVDGVEIHFKDRTNPETGKKLGGIEIVKINNTKQKGQGKAREALRQFLDYADRNKQDIYLFAKPLDLQTNEDRLISFYEGMGFKSVSKSLRQEMVRKAQKLQPQFSKESNLINRINQIKGSLIDENGITGKALITILGGLDGINKIGEGYQGQTSILNKYVDYESSVVVKHPDMVDDSGEGWNYYTLNYSNNKEDTLHGGEWYSPEMSEESIKKDLWKGTDINNAGGIQAFFQDNITGDIYVDAYASENYLSTLRIKAWEESLDAEMLFDVFTNTLNLFKEIPLLNKYASYTLKEGVKMGKDEIYRIDDDNKTISINKRAGIINKIVNEDGFDKIGSLLQLDGVSDIDMSSYLKHGGSWLLNFLDDINMRTFNKPLFSVNDYAVKLATQVQFSNDIRFSMIGIEGATLMQKANETLTILKDLEVAREMETKLGLTEEDWRKYGRKEDLKSDAELEKYLNKLKIQIATGWFKTPNGEWKYEISDETLNINTDLIESTIKNMPDKRSYSIKSADLVIGGITEIYPEIDNIKVYLHKNMGEAVASFDGLSNTIRINIGKITDYNEIRRTIIHEYSHWVQKREGFTGGTSLDRELELETNEFISRTGRQPNEEEKRTLQELAEFKYLTTYGELEARANEGRLQMVEEDRRYTLFSENLDFPLEQIKTVEENMRKKLYSNNSVQEKLDTQILEEVYNQLKKTRLVDNTFFLTNQQIEDKLRELGYSEDIVKSVSAWHGSPHLFDRFTTDRMGTGEGAQAFGWGLYFTDLESIAKGYAKALATLNYKGQDISQVEFFDILLGGLDASNADFYDYENGTIFNLKEFKNYINDSVEYFSNMVIDENSPSVSRLMQDYEYRDSELAKAKEYYKLIKDTNFDTLESSLITAGLDEKTAKSLADDAKRNKEANTNYLKNAVKYLANRDTTIKTIVENEKRRTQSSLNYFKFIQKNFDNIGLSRNLYKVSLHKGKQPSEYTWLEWDKPLNEDILNKLPIDIKKTVFDYNEDELNKEVDKVSLQYKVKNKQVIKRENIKDFYQSFGYSTNRVEELTNNRLKKEGEYFVFILEESMTTPSEVFKNREDANKYAEAYKLERNEYLFPPNAIKNSFEVREEVKTYFDIFDYNITGEELYKRIIERITTDNDYNRDLEWLDRSGQPSSKQASLFLLENGIDGIKYPAESIARGATSDNARGFNYVVFDENAVTIEESIQFQIIGEKGARNLDKVQEGTIRINNLKRAKKAESTGEDPRTIKLATGWERGVDGKWKMETEYPTPKVDLKANWKGKLSDFIGEDSEILKAFPQFKDMPITYTLNPSMRETGWYIPEKGGVGSIELNVKDSYRASTMLSHELQHAVQFQEGFAVGGAYEIIIKNIDRLLPEEVKILITEARRANEVERSLSFIAEYAIDEDISDISEFYSNPDNLIPFEHALEEGVTVEDVSEYWITTLKPLIEDYYSNDEYDFYDVMSYENPKLQETLDKYSLHRLYESLSGEVEARNAERRSGMSSDAKKNRLLADTQDVAKEDQLVILDYFGAMASTKSRVKVTTNGFLVNEGGQENAYINMDSRNPTETLLHEHVHSFINKLKQSNPELYNRGIELAQSAEAKEISDFIKQNQPTLIEGTKAFSEEVLAEISGRRAYELLASKENSEVKTWLQEFFDYLRNLLGLTDYTNEQVAQMSLNEYADAMGISLLKGEELFQNRQTRDEYKVGYRADTEQVARERFDIPNLEQIGKGSDRTVFKLDDGKVLKVAHSARGLSQNYNEGDYYLSSLVPEVYERGLNYVVVQETPRINNKDVVTTYDVDGNEIGETTAGQMIKDLSKFTQRDFDLRDSKLQDVIYKYGFQDILSYEVLYNDFSAKRNWGYLNGQAVHLDGGTFGGVQMINEYKGVKNLEDDEFRDIYNKSRQVKKEFGDADKYTMFSKEAYNQAQDIDRQLAEIARINPNLVAEIASSVYEDAGYHRGSLPQKSDEISEGYIGENPWTGYYFVGDAERVVRGGSRFGDPTAFRIADFSKYNLLKFENAEDYFATKNSLKKLANNINEYKSVDALLNDFYTNKDLKRKIRNYNGNEADVKEIKQRIYKLDLLLDNVKSSREFTAITDEISKLKREVALSKIISFQDLLETIIANEYKTERQNNKFSERLETKILKYLGYEGIDVRGLVQMNGLKSPDGFSDGSVLFDLKPNTTTTIREAYLKAKQNRNNPQLVNLVEAATNFTEETMTITTINNPQSLSQKIEAMIENGEITRVCKL